MGARNLELTRSHMFDVSLFLGTNVSFEKLYNHLIWGAGQDRGGGGGGGLFVFETSPLAAIRTFITYNSQLHVYYLQIFQYFWQYTI